MCLRRIVVLALGSLLWIAGRSSAAAPQRALRASSASACALLTRSQVSAVQRARITAAKANSRSDGARSVFQCFYTAEPFAMSVSLELTRPADRAGDGPREHWMRLFHPTAGSEAEEQRERPREGESAKPQPVMGVGEEAFWIKTGPVGALFVLKNDSYIRISVGGSGNHPIKLERSKQLAATALRRLP